MGEPEGGRRASCIPFMLPHYWGRGGTSESFLYSLLAVPQEHFCDPEAPSRVAVQADADFCEARL